VTLARVTLTGYYTDGQGSPLTGVLQFTPSVALAAGPDRRSLPQAQVNVTVPASGRFTAALYATDNADITPAGWWWNVQEQLAGITRPAPWSFYLPAQATAFTATDASPCVFTAAGTWPDGTGVQLAGSPPAGFTTATTYYVTAAGSGTFGLAATIGGSAAGSASAGSGTVTVVQQDISSVTAA
jgi:hypothetical protein